MMYMLVLISQVLIPLLSNPKNQATWPSVVSQDVLRHAHQLKNNVFVIAGQVKGRTLLPIPAGAESVAVDNNNNTSM